MSISIEHLPYYAEILALDGFLRDPVLTFGCHDFKDSRFPSLRRQMGRRIRVYLTLGLKRRPWTDARFRPMREVPRKFRAATFGEILHNHGVKEVRMLDLFDSRADLRIDMNDPLPDGLNGRFGTVIDIGSIEHVFDTRQCLSNLFDLVAVQGHLLLHTPCNGFFDHGFHTFSPECMLQALELNGFEVRYLKFSGVGGAELKDPEAGWSSLMWIVARKVRCAGAFVVPQQGRWKPIYTARAVQAV